MSHSVNLKISDCVEIPSIYNCFTAVQIVAECFNTLKRREVLIQNIEKN